MNMKILVAIILLTISFSGCIEEEITTTTYTCTTGSKMHLQSDGTYVVDPITEDAFHGNYTTIDNELFLKCSLFGICFKFVQNDTDYIDYEGDRWTLKTTIDNSSEI